MLIAATVLGLSLLVLPTEVRLKVNADGVGRLNCTISSSNWVDVGWFTAYTFPAPSTVSWR